MQVCLLKSRHKTSMLGCFYDTNGQDCPERHQVSWNAEVGKVPTKWGEGVLETFQGHRRHRLEGGEDSCQVAGRKA